MKANELRIGNLIADSGGNKWQIDHWEGEDKVASKRPILGKLLFNDMPMFGHPATEYVEQLQPIPLTEEMLLKLGFSYRKHLEDFFIKLSDNCILAIEINGVTFICGSNQQRILLSMTKHLHQLQNLYFALAGEELDITNLLP